QGPGGQGPGGQGPGGQGPGGQGPGGQGPGAPTSYELGYSSLIGGLGWERVQGIYVSPDGSIFLGGNTSSSNFPVTPGAFQTTKLGPADGNQPNSATGYIVKLDPTGQTILWATYLGGSRRDQVYAVRTDSAGNIYAVGATGSDDFPTTSGAYDPTFNGPLQNNGLTDIFVTKFDPNGQLLFSTYVGGSAPGEENPRGSIEIDETRGRIYVAGLTKSTNFPTTPGSLQPDYGGGGEDGFVFALSLDGSTLEASTYIGGSGLDMAFSEIEQHPDGSLYIGGWTTSGNFPATAGAFQENLGGGRDGWVARIGPDLDQLVWASYLGGSQQDAVNHNQSIGIDAQGRPVVIGTTQSSDFPTTAGAFQTTTTSGGDLFVAVFSEDGTTLDASTLLGGDGEDYPSGLFVAPSGQVAFSGATSSTDYPTVAPYQATFAGNANSTDVILTVLTSDLTSLVFSSYFGGTGTQSSGERGRGVWITPSGEIWFSGVTDNGGFPVTSDAYDSTYGGSTADGIFLRLDPKYD
ncbi:MAG TPA: hypothetical protein ENK19_05580, partial [Acidobacteria bacterium]|nr:hypothetical protein [Acidobacteriota bacterium]